MTRWTAALFALATPLAAGPLPTADAVFPEQDKRLAQLGWHLFYDPILSGNKEVACATCHHPKHGTSDGLSLGLGDGGRGLGPDRVASVKNPPEQRIPRNAPALFNLGAEEFGVMFHDGRLERNPDHPDGIRTPLGAEMVHGFSGVLSAQSMFPVLSGHEMAGHYSESDVSQAVRQGFLTGEGGAWQIISDRVAAIPAYRDGFAEVLGKDQRIGFTHISDALAAFMAWEWRADNSPFDQYLKGEAALGDDAMRGMELFYGDAGCGTCHSGQFQTDHDFHAIAMPQIGPGKAAPYERHARDEGRMRVTGRVDDAYAFRTPSLRNITETGPYGHTGAYSSLEATVRHHLNPVGSLMSYDRTQAVLPTLERANDWRVMDDTDEVLAIAEANELHSLTLSDGQVADILAFLEALTDEASIAGKLGVPDSVPSGLAVPN